MTTWSDERWRDYLIARLTSRWDEGIGGGRPWKLLGDYYEGIHRLQFATAKYMEAFGRLFDEFADNFCGLTVDALVERLRVQGLRFGTDAAGDKEAWTHWQANRLDGEAPQLWQVAVTYGEGYWLVDEPAEPRGIPRVTAEHPRQMIVETDPGDRGTRLAALKRWQARDGRELVTLWLPDRIVRWERRRNAAGGIVLPAGTTSGAWMPRTDADHQQDHGFGDVPVVPVMNRPSMLIGGRSDVEPVVGLQDTINKLGTDMVLNSEFQAYAQRVLTGVSPPKDPDTGQPIPRQQLEAGVNRLMFFANPQAKAQQWDAGDPAKLVNAIEMWVQHLSAQGRTPPHYLLGRIVNAAGDALEAAEAGLKARTLGAQTNFGEPTEEMQRLCFIARGDTERAARNDAEVIWGDPGFTSEGAKVDAALKRKALGLPNRIVWEQLGMSPQEIERAESEAFTDGLLTGGLTADQAATVVVNREQQAAEQTRLAAAQGLRAIPAEAA